MKLGTGNFTGVFIIFSRVRVRAHALGVSVVLERYISMPLKIKIKTGSKYDEIYTEPNPFSFALLVTV